MSMYEDDEPHVVPPDIILPPSTTLPPKFVPSPYLSPMNIPRLFVSIQVSALSPLSTNPMYINPPDDMLLNPTDSAFILIIQLSPRSPTFT